MRLFRGAHAPRVLRPAPSPVVYLKVKEISARRRNLHARARALPGLLMFARFGLQISFIAPLGQMDGFEMKRLAMQFRRRHPAIDTLKFPGEDGSEFLIIA
ncbi:MAG: hypothetical protein QOG67_2443 [Verrucomicrobiota bacterium]